MIPTLRPLLRVLPGIDHPWASCRWCREPDSFTHNLTHVATYDGTAFQWPLHHGYCMGQELTRNHVNYFTAYLGHPILPRASEVGPPTGRRDRANAIKELGRCIERAAQLWSHRDDAGWLDDARRVLAIVDPQAPQHHQVLVDAEDVALFEVSA